MARRKTSHESLDSNRVLCWSYTTHENFLKAWMWGQLSAFLKVLCVRAHESHPWMQLSEGNFQHSAFISGRWNISSFRESSSLLASKHTEGIQITSNFCFLYFQMILFKNWVLLVLIPIKWIPEIMRRKCSLSSTSVITICFGIHPTICIQRETTRRRHGLKWGA